MNKIFDFAMAAALLVIAFATAAVFGAVAYRLIFYGLE